MASPLVPPLAIGSYPTPVERLAALSEGERALWVKRDDLTDAGYGGNKVRKLEHLLARARAKGARRIVTVGAAGSHHVLATVVHARRLGLDVEAVLVPQPRTEHALDDLRADLALGLVAYPARSWAMVPLLVAWRVLAGAHYVPVGGSNLTGAMGYVDGARELAAQVRAGELPEPDVVVVTLGSGGTAAGLAAGLEIEGLRSRVLAVCVADPVWAAAWMARRLARACLRRAGGRPARAFEARLEIDRRWLGAGYGHATPEGARATEVAASEGLTLDPTYTAKTFAAALDRLKTGTERTVLYWHTLSSAPMEPLLRGAPKEEELDPRLRALLV